MTLTKNTFTINTINSKKINVKLLNNIKRYIAPTHCISSKHYIISKVNRILFTPTSVDSIHLRLRIHFLMPRLMQGKSIQNHMICGLFLIGATSIILGCNHPYLPLYPFQLFSPSLLRRMLIHITFCFFLEQSSLTVIFSSSCTRGHGAV